MDTFEIKVGMVAEKLAIGTAQFGTEYGIANKIGDIGSLALESILNLGKLAGISTIDTASTYGRCESLLGSYGVEDWNVVTKLRVLPRGIVDVDQWVGEEIKKSLKILGVRSIYGILVHDVSDLFSCNGDNLIRALSVQKKHGVVKKIGVSIYDPNDLEFLVSNYQLDIVQAPFNVFDRRILLSGWLKHLDQAGIEFHARSIFLQGLLLMECHTYPPYFSRWQAVLEQWRQWLCKNRLNALQACLDFVMNHRIIDRVIVGLESEKQLENILNTKISSNPLVPDSLISEDLNLIDPRNWT